MAQQIGRNIKAEVKGRSLILTIDLDAPAPPSKSGKTLLLSTSGGNKLVEGTDGLSLGLNAYRPNG